MPIYEIQKGDKIRVTFIDPSTSCGRSDDQVAALRSCLGEEAEVVAIVARPLRHVKLYQVVIEGVTCEFLRHEFDLVDYDASGFFGNGE